MPVSDSAAYEEIALSRVGASVTRKYSSVQRVAVGAVAASSAAIAGSEILVHPSTKCYIKVGASPQTASATDSIPVEAGEKFHLRINSGDVLSVIQDSAAGFIHIVVSAA